MADIEIIGLALTEENIKDVLTHVLAKSQELVDAAVDDCYNEAYDTVPVATGQLRSSLTPVYAGDSGESTPTMVVGYVYADDLVADYGQYVELGTRFMVAQPFLRPAYEVAAETMTSDADHVLDGL